MRLEQPVALTHYMCIYFLVMEVADLSSSSHRKKETGPKVIKA